MGETIHEEGLVQTPPILKYSLNVTYIVLLINIEAFLAFIFTVLFEDRDLQLNNQKDNGPLLFAAYETSSNKNLISSLLLDSKTLIFDIYITPAECKTAGVGVS